MYRGSCEGRARGQALTPVEVSARWRWLVTDIDGTLVDSDQQIVARNRSALEVFAASGRQTILATGRMEASVLGFQRELNLTSPAILYNGAKIVDLVSGEMIFEQPLPDDSHDTVLSILDRLKMPAARVVFARRHAYVVEGGPAYDGYALKDRIKLTRLRSFAEVGSSPITKCLLICSLEMIDEVSACLKATISGIRVIRSESNYLEILHAGASKGTALMWMSDRFGVPLPEIAAVGDNLNDLEMLKVAGMGIAVGDGHEVLRRAADVVVGPCKDGAVADAVHLLLGECVPKREICECPPE